MGIEGRLQFMITSKTFIAFEPSRVKVRSDRNSLVAFQQRPLKLFCRSAYVLVR